MIGIVLGVSVPALLAVGMITWLLGSNRTSAPLSSAPLSSAPLVPTPLTPALVERRLVPTPLTPALGERRLDAIAADTPIERASLGAFPSSTAEPPNAKASLTHSMQAYPQNVADKPVPRVGAEPWMISEAWQAHHERLLHAANRAEARVVFLGDSITEGWGVAQAYKASFARYTPLDLGLAGDFTQNVLWRVAHGALDGTDPSVLVLMVGVNNLAGGFSAQQTVNGIRAIVSEVRTRLPHTKILLLAILPAREHPSDPVRQRILESNRLLAEMPETPFVSFQDVGAVLLEPDGSLSKATVRDFVHPTAEGYARLTNAVAPLLDTLLAPDAK